MDILERIIEAVAQKLISMKLEEITMQDVKIAKRNIAAKKAGRAAGEGKKFGRSGEAKKVDPLTPTQAGASGNQRKRFSPGGDLSTGTEEDPFNRAARTKPIKPEIGKTSGPGGGKEETKSKVAKGKNKGS